MRGIAQQTPDNSFVKKESVNTLILFIVSPFLILKKQRQRSEKI